MSHYKPEKQDKHEQHEKYEKYEKQDKYEKKDKEKKRDDDDDKHPQYKNVISVNLKATNINPYAKEYDKLLKNMQGNILKGHGRDNSVHIFLKFTADTKSVRKWIEFFAKKYVISAEQQLKDTEKYKKNKISGGLFGNFFLSAKGYETIGFTKQSIQSAFVEEDVFLGNEKVDVKFTKGMAAAQRELEDPPINSWEQGYRYQQQTIDAAILLAHENEDVLYREATAVMQDLKAISTVLAVEYGKALRNNKGEGIEHFGYVDGRSQPLFLSSDIEGERNKDGIDKWEPSAPLELALVKDPFAEEQDCFGSYVVFRKLEQNVRGFKQREEQLAQALGLTGEDEERAGALVVGRFEDGTPVVLQPSEGLNSPVPNNFTYDDDLAGRKCPFHAHIRKMNPRNDIPNFFAPNEAVKQQLEEEERSHRIVRRGIPFGKRQVEPKDNPTFEQMPTGGVGLLFMCFQSNIARQFGFMQKNWANNLHFVQPETGIDPVIGQQAIGEASLAQQWPPQWGEPGKQSFDFGHFVTMKGGEFFFAPSLAFLRRLKKED
jgi:Dyp-type peroxidase family